MSITKTFKFNNTSIIFSEINGVWLIPAKMVGQALGYANDGQKLVDLISNDWGKNWSKNDFPVFGGTMMQKIRTETPEFGVAPKARSMMFLTPSGVVQVLQRSRAKLAKEFRHFLTTKFKSMFDGYGLEKTNSTQTLVQKNEKSDTLDNMLKVAESAAKRGLLSKPEQKKLYGRILDIQMEVFTRENKVTHFISDGTVPPTNLPALSNGAMAIQEGSVNLLNVKDHHPDFQDWKSAHEIGAAYGLKSDLVKKYIKAYVLSLQTDLPNNLADEFIARNDGKFPTPDRHGFLVFEGLRNIGVAIYSKIDGNKLVWRNFWSPTAVLSINALIELDRGIKPLPVVSEEIKVETMATLPAAEITVDAEVIKNIPSNFTPETVDQKNG